jgi:hypothetical protein
VTGAFTAVLSVISVSVYYRYRVQAMMQVVVDGGWWMVSRSSDSKGEKNISSPPFRVPNLKLQSFYSGYDYSSTVFCIGVLP